MLILWLGLRPQTELALKFREANFLREALQDGCSCNRGLAARLFRRPDTAWSASDVGLRRTRVRNFSGNLSGIAAPFITGVLAPQTGSFIVPFTLGALSMIPGILAYIFVVGKVETPDSPL